MKQNIKNEIDEELEINGINSIDNLIKSGIQTSIIYNLLYNNSETFRKQNKKDMKNYINLLIKEYDEVYKVKEAILN